MTRRAVLCFRAAATLAVCGFGPSAFWSSAHAQVFTEPAPPVRKPKPKIQPRVQPSQPSSPAVKPPKMRAVAPRIATYSDPAAYCSANPGSEGIGPSYVGQPMPGWISAAIAPTSAAGAQSQAYSWRCMSGRVLACSSTADRSECSKPVDDRTPTEEMSAFCKGKRRGAIAVEITGNAIPIWACSRNGPVITGYRTDIDQAGYLKGPWQDVTDFAPANTVGAVPRQYVGSWIANLKTTGILPTYFRVEVKINGGRINENIAEIRYIQTNTGFDKGPELVCMSRVSLAGYGNGQLIGVESRTYRVAMIDACPVKGPIHLQARDGQLWLEWRRPSDGKVTLSGWGQRN